MVIVGTVITGSVASRFSYASYCGKPGARLRRQR